MEGITNSINKIRIINITNVTPSLDLQPNVTYKCLNPLTSLTLGNIPNSLFDIAIYFTTDSTSFTFTATALINNWYGITSPEFELGKEYVICINNGKAVLGKIGE